MHKRDFIQQAAIEFLPHREWKVDEAVNYAERLWQRLGERGYGDTKPTGPHDIAKAYDKLNALHKTGFDLFWNAFDYKRGKDEAAASWLQLNPGKNETQDIIAAAKQEAANRKNLPPEQVAIMAQGWLNKRRWLDTQATSTDKKQLEENKREQEIRRITQDLAHAKRMTEQTGEDYWFGEAAKLTEQLKNKRDQLC